MNKVLDALKIENLKGIRTTIIYGIFLVGLHCALFTQNIGEETYHGIMVWSFGIYTGAKTAYKGLEKITKNGEKTQ